MVFCNADFIVSKTPVASVALQAAAKKAINDVAKKTLGTRHFAAALQSQLEALMGSGWHILIGSDFAVDLRYRKGACVLLYSKASKIKVMLYRTMPSVTSSPVKEHIALIETNNQVSVTKKTIVYESSMEDEVKATIIDKTKRLINYYKDVEEKEEKIAQALKHSLTFVQGPTWQVIVSSSHDLCCRPIADEGTHLDFTMAKLRVVVYRHAGTTLDRQLDMALFGQRVAFVLATMCLLLYGFMSLNSSAMVENCKGNANIVSDILAHEVNRLEDCPEESLERANDITSWRNAAIVSTSGFTMIASLIRMYSKSLAATSKRS